jgi:hypothetical protein
MDPWEQVSAVLAEAKRKGWPWDLAWLNAMRTFCPPRTASVQYQAAMQQERDLLHELRPWWQASYEGRDVTIEEFERASDLAEKRLDSLLVAA